MKLKELFSKPIERPINPAVVVSKRDTQTINTEIEEYVFTQDLMENLYRFLNNFLNQEQDKTGIWVNGYYGSGKSHFIKYVYYCLHPETSDKAFEHFLNKVREDGDELSDVTPAAVSDLKRKIDKSEIDTIIFNIDAVAGQKNEKEKITKIFYNQFNGFRGYNSTNIPLAILLEKHLDKLGVFASFKEKIKETFKTDWEKDAITLTSLKLNKVLEIAQSFDSELDLDSLRAKIKNPDDITISDNLIPEFLEFLEDKDDNYRLLFMVDEVSQYIGSDTNLLLNLQTIIEELGSQCGNRIWLATTAQQTLDEIIQNTDNQGEDFGKILGRFETRISLRSQDADYITKKRILDKNSDAIKVLTDIYKKEKDAIKNQFIFEHDLYKGYETMQEFFLSYPFVPYQFRLVSDVIDSFSHLNYVIKEVKDNERSVLAITHYTVKKNKEQETGYFIPFDAFFNELFEQNLTHLARNILERAKSITEIKNDAFALRVVHVLFMISNLDEHKMLTFPPNIDNLTQILMDQIDTNRLELQNKIQKVLDKLIEKNIIHEDDGHYVFYKEDEIEVANLIESTQTTLDDRLQTLYDDFLEKMLHVQRKVSFGNNAFSIYLNVDGKEIFSKGDVNVFITAYEKQDINTKALNVNKHDLVVGISEWFFKDESLRKEFEQYVRTKKYIKLNSDVAKGTRKKTIEKFGMQNNHKLTELRKKFELKFAETPFISAQQVIQPQDIHVTEPAKRFNEALQLHLKEIYKKNHLTVSKTNDELRNAAASKQRNLDKTLSPAEMQVDSHISQFGDNITVEDVIKHFSRPPFGWKDNATIGMLLSLAQKNKRKFEWRNDPIDLKNFVEKALKANERAAIVIKSIEEIGGDLMNDVRTAYRQIFNEDLREKHEAGILYEEIKKQLSKKETFFNKYEEEYYGKTPFGHHFHDLRKRLTNYGEVRDPKKLFEMLIADQQETRKIHDLCKDLVDFITHQIKNYDTIKKFAQENKANFSSLDPEDREKAEALLEYFESEDRPADQFPHIKKIYDELKLKLQEYYTTLQEKAIDVYQKINTELDAKAKEYQVNESAVVYDPKTKIDEIKREKDITKLKLIIANADRYKADVVEQMLKMAETGKSDEKQVERFKIRITEIKDEEQLNIYLNWLKEQLLKKLRDNKIIVIE